MKYRLVFVEITNFCGLSCDFCPPEERKKEQMDIALFTKIIKELKLIARRVALHLRGEPLSVANLDEYIEIAKQNSVKLEITTNSHYLTKDKFDLLLKSSIAQINFSLQSIVANSKLRDTNKDIAKVIDFCNYALKFENRPFINLRLWALKDELLLNMIHKAFNVESNKLASKIRLTTAPLFEWPDLKLPEYKDSYCHAPFDQFGILSNGTVVPCCLDKDGIINLGNVNEKSIIDILNSDRAQFLKNGFTKNKAIEELCKHCSYRLKFEK